MMMEMRIQLLQLSTILVSSVSWLALLSASLCFHGTTAEDDDTIDVAGCFYDSSDGTFLSDCPPAEMTERTFIFPEGDTGCLDPDAPFFWDFFPGRGADANNLIINFDGGEYCRNEFECTSPFWFDVKRAPEPRARGIFNRTNPENYFRDWTIVNILVCTGDAHTGNASLGDGSRVVFRGQEDARVALEWTMLNFPQPDRLLLIGCSSGSIGAQFWARSILQFYQDKPTVTSVVLDSLVGELALLEPFIFAMRATWNSCSVEHLRARPDDFQACLSGAYTIVDEQAQVQAMYRDTVPFAFLSYKFDHFISVAYCFNVFPSLCPQSLLYRRMQEVLRDYTVLNDNDSNNIVSYFVNGIGHCFTDDENDFYVRTSMGSRSQRYGDERFVDWIRDLAYRDPTSTVVESRCVPHRWSFLPIPFFNFGCDEKLTSAEFRP